MDGSTFKHPVKSGVCLNERVQVIKGGKESGLEQRKNKSAVALFSRD